MGLIIDEYDKELSFYYGTPGLKLGIIISVIGFALATIEIFVDKKRKY